MTQAKWTKSEIDMVVRRINRLLQADVDASRFDLHIPAGATQVDEDWLLVVVEPRCDGVRAYDYVMKLAEVEAALRTSGTEKVTLVPALPVA